MTTKLIEIETKKLKIDFIYHGWFKRKGVIFICFLPFFYYARWKFDKDRPNENRNFINAKWLLWSLYIKW